MTKARSPRVLRDEDKTTGLFDVVHEHPVDDEVAKAHSLHRLVTSHSLSKETAKKVLGMK